VPRFLGPGDVLWVWREEEEEEEEEDEDGWMMDTLRICMSKEMSRT